MSREKSSHGPTEELPQLHSIKKESWRSLSDLSLNRQSETDLSQNLIPNPAKSSYHRKKTMQDLEAIEQARKAEAEKKKMIITEFKNFIETQSPGKYFNHESNNALAPSSSLFPSKFFPSRNQRGGLALLSQTSFHSVIDMTAPAPACESPQMSKHTQESVTSNFNSSSMSLSPSMQKSSVTRQTSIAQEIQRRLKIVHKSRDQRFNENMKLFKGVSTYIETKPFLQNLNLLNSRTLVEKIKKNQKWDAQFEEMRRRSQLFSVPSKSTQNLLNYSSQEDFSMQQNREKYQVENPEFDSNINDLLQKAFDQTKQSMKSRNINPLIPQEMIESLNVVQAFESTDEEYFYELLKSELEKMQAKEKQKKEQEEEDQNIKKKSVFLKRLQTRILDEVYSNDALVTQLSPVQIKEFVNKQLLKDGQNMNPQNPQEKIVQGLEIDQNTTLDAKSQYKEYIQRAAQVRATLHRLNENFFKKKWANAQIKQKHEKEKMRQDIMLKMQNQSISKSKEDLLFPAKKKMPNIKSRIDSNLDFINIQSSFSPNEIINQKIPIARPFISPSSNKLSSPSVYGIRSFGQIESRTSTKSHSRANSTSNNFFFPVHQRNPSTTSISTSHIDHINESKEFFVNPAAVSQHGIGEKVKSNNVSLHQKNTSQMGTSELPQLPQSVMQRRLLQLTKVQGNSSINLNQASEKNYGTIVSQFNQIPLVKEFERDRRSSNALSDEQLLEGRKRQSTISLIEAGLITQTQKSKLNTLLNNIELQKRTDKKEKKVLEKEILNLQSSCEAEMKQIKGAPLDNIQTVLDIDVLNFSKNTPISRITDSNIKSFLLKNN